MGVALKDYYQQIEAELIADDAAPGSGSQPKPADATRPAAGGSAAPMTRQGPSLVPISGEAVESKAPEKTEADHPAHRIIDAGRQQEEVAMSHKALVNLLAEAKAGNEIALAQIIKKYGWDPQNLEITITRPLLDSQGQEPEKYGIKIVRNEEEWATVAADFETVSGYFSGLELHDFSTTRRGRRLAVVMGISAREFNAIIAAERQRERMEGEMRIYGRDIDMGRKDLGVDKIERVQTGKDKKPLPETPATAKTLSNLLKSSRTK